MQITSAILSKLINSLGLSPAEFEREIGASNASIVKAMQRESKISDGVKYKILQRYPQVNEKWLLTGKGDMFIEGENQSQFTLSDFLQAYRFGVSKPGGGKLSTREMAGLLGADIVADNITKWEMRGTIPRDEAHRTAIRNFFGIEDLDNPTREELQNAIAIYPNSMAIGPSKDREVIILGKHAHNRLTPHQYSESFKNWPGVPMYNAPVTASFVETYRDDKIYQPSYYLHDPRFKDCNFGAIITGDSMHSEIRHGDHVICQEVIDKRFIVFGDIYYILSTNGLETCKYLNIDPADKNNFLLVPKNDLISPSPIPKDMILRLFKVRGIMRGY